MTRPSRLIRRCAGAVAVVSAAAAVSSCTIVKKAVNGPFAYYVSQSGSDSADGTSPATAWRTLGRVNDATIRPGSRILLRGGDRFTGQLRLGKRDAGSAAHPVTIESYGTGTATIYAPGESGVTVFDTAGVDVQNLRITGSGHAGNGVDVYSDLPAGKRLKHVFVTGVRVNGFLHGISIGGKHRAAGFADVQVTDSVSYGNVDSGLLLFGPAFDAKSPAYANQDVRVARVAASGNLGDPAQKTSGSGNGIVLGSVSHGLVAWSTANGNGGRGNAGQEGAGIWTYDSTGVTIAHNLSYGNKTRNRIDGDGFDLDENTSDSIVEDNLSYGNYGAGYLVYSPLNSGTQHGDVIRNNISSDDTRDGSPGYGGITATGYVSDLAVYQNTVVTGASAALRIDHLIQGVTVANNIFSTRSGPVLKATAALAHDAVTFRGNDYYSAAGWRLLWGTRTYSSLPAWRAGTSQEARDGRPTGHALAPRLAGPTFGLAARTATDTAAALGFQLAPGSPLSGAGIDLAHLGLAADATNFLGQARAAQHPNVGAL